MKNALPYLSIAVVVAALTLFANLPDGVAMALKLVVALLALIVAIIGFQSGGKHSGTPVPVSSEEVAKPVASSEARGGADAEVITFLSRLQEKGRLIDFLMDDISGHDDAAVGAAARVVHQGCRAVVDEHLSIEAIESTPEGSSISLPEGYDANQYRLTGNLSGKAPFSGTLVHKGWKVSSVNLPKVIVSDSDDLPPLAHAQVDI